MLRVCMAAVSSSFVFTPVPGCRLAQVGTEVTGQKVPPSLSCGRVWMHATSLNVGRFIYQTHGLSSWSAQNSLSCGIVQASINGERTIAEVCHNRLPAWLLQRAEDLGFGKATQAQADALPVLLDGEDCLIHAPTGSGKTLAYLLPLLSQIDPTRAVVQALIVVPTRELGIQVVGVARNLVKRGVEEACQESEQPSGGSKAGIVEVMALFDGGSSSRHKAWLKADPPQLVVGTLDRIHTLIQQRSLSLHSLRFLVVDEVDAVIENSFRGSSNGLTVILTQASRADRRQTIFASATIPQHHRFLADCVNNKWTKGKVSHIHVQSQEKVPSYLLHKFLVCERNERLKALHAVMCRDEPKAAIIFVSKQAEKGKRAGEEHPALVIAKYLHERGQKSSKLQHTQTETFVLTEDGSVQARFAALDGFRKGCGGVLIASDVLGARGLDLPHVSHVYNYELPPHLNSYIHRAGRTARSPLGQHIGTVSTLLSKNELFVLRRYENELGITFFQDTI